MIYITVISFILGLAFLLFGYFIYFKRKYSLINGFNADFEAGRKTESYAKRVGLTEFVIGIVLLSIFITGVCVMIFGNSKNTVGKTITDFEVVTLRLSGMRVTEEYELVANGEQTEISYYNMFYGNGEDERRLVKRTVCDTQTVIDTLNGFGFAGWNGFHGERPRGLLDGTDFRLTAVVNGGQRMYAQGSENFPKHFHEFEQWLYDILNNAE